VAATGHFFEMETPMYTLVHYRPNGVKSFRGHVTDRCDSELVINTFADLDAAAKDLAKFRFANETKDKDYWITNWETTILIDGYQENDHPAWQQTDYNGDDYVELECTARVVLEQLKQQHLLEKEKEKAAAAQAAENKRHAAAKATEEYERAELNRLLKKFGL
jgi:hypothetical protein